MPCTDTAPDRAEERSQRLATMLVWMERNGPETGSTLDSAVYEAARSAYGNVGLNNAMTRELCKRFQAFTSEEWKAFVGEHADEGLMPMLMRERRQHREADQAREKAQREESRKQAARADAHMALKAAAGEATEELLRAARSGSLVDTLDAAVGKAGLRGNEAMAAAALALAAASAELKLRRRASV